MRIDPLEHVVVEVEPEGAERRWTDGRLFTRSPFWKSGGVRGHGASVVQQGVGEGGAVLLDVVRRLGGGRIGRCVGACVSQLPALG